MPVYSRRQLRQSLGQRYLGDTEVGNVTASLGNGTVIDAARADTSFTNEGLYARAWVRANGMTLRVATFNTMSGAFLTGQIAATTVPSGAEYEVHTVTDPDTKDRILTDVIRTLRFRQEVVIPAVDGDGSYSIGQDVDVLDCRYFADPTNTLDRDEHPVRWFKAETTASGTRELRISPPLSQSQALVLIAIVAGSLGPADTDTIQLPDDEWPLVGAAARCYWLAESKSPGQETNLYGQTRKELARSFALKCQRYQPLVTRRVQFDEPF